MNTRTDMFLHDILLDISKFSPGNYQDRWFTLLTKKAMGKTTQACERQDDYIRAHERVYFPPRGD
jgi:hypothetical protein